MAELYTSQDSELLREPSYYAIIPASVRYDPELRASAKLLYGELTALCGKTGYCWASNSYFAELYHLSDKTVSELMLQLERRGHIKREVVRNERNEVVQRRIYVSACPAAPSPEKSGEGYTENSGDPPPKKPEDNNTSNNNTSNPPIAPQGGDPKPEADEPEKSVPKWKPERFEAFWDFYGYKVGRKKAVRAWDKLKPSDKLLARMGCALELQKQSPQWTEDGGRYRPRPSTWLNGAEWENELPESPPPADEWEGFRNWN